MHILKCRYLYYLSASTYLYLNKLYSSQVLHFDCMDMSSGGIGLSKPSGSGSNTNLSPVDNATIVEPTQLDFDVYDPVTEKIETTEQSPYEN